MFQNLTFWKRSWLVISLYVIHGVIAEDIMVTVNKKGLNLSWFFSFITVATQMVSAYTTLANRHHESMKPISHNIKNVFRIWKSEYLAAGLLTMFSQVLNNYAAIFLNYNTVKMFKTSKIIVIMLTCWTFLGRYYSITSGILALMQVGSLLLLSLADMRHQPSNGKLQVDLETSQTNQAFGFYILGVSLISMALTNSIQEASLTDAQFKSPFTKRIPTKRIHGSKHAVDELMFFSTATTTVLLFAGSVYYGDLLLGLRFYWSSPKRYLAEQIALLAITTYGQREILDIARVYGSPSASIVVTVRQVLTYMVSVILFPKPFTLLHAVSIGGTSLSAYFLQESIMQGNKKEAIEVPMSIV